MPAKGHSRLQRHPNRPATPRPTYAPMSVDACGVGKRMETPPQLVLLPRKRRGAAIAPELFSEGFAPANNSARGALGSASIGYGCGQANGTHAMRLVLRLKTAKGSSGEASPREIRKETLEPNALEYICDVMAVAESSSCAALFKLPSASPKRSVATANTSAPAPKAIHLPQAWPRPPASFPVVARPLSQPPQTVRNSLAPEETTMAV